MCWHTDRRSCYETCVRRRYRGSVASPLALEKETPDHSYSSHWHGSRDDLTLWLQFSTSSLMRLLPRRSYRDNDRATAYLLGVKCIGKCLGRNFPCKLFKWLSPEIQVLVSLWWFIFSVVILWGRKDPQRQNISRASIIKEAPTMSTQHSPLKSFLHYAILEDNRDPKHFFFFSFHECFWRRPASGKLAHCLPSVWWEAPRVSLSVSSVWVSARWIS